MKTLLLASAVFAGLFVCLSADPTPTPGPYHAFCKLVWSFATNCTEINARVLQQIQDFSLSGQYMLVSATPLSIVANHTSLDGTQTEKINITFPKGVQGRGCKALSTSLGFTSRLDNGLNYCNLYNVVAESGLISEPGFREKTNPFACLGYKMSTCEA